MSAPADGTERATPRPVRRVVGGVVRRTAAAALAAGALAACEAARRPAPAAAAHLEVGYRGWTTPAGARRAPALGARVETGHASLQLRAGGALAVGDGGVQLLDARLTAAAAAGPVRGVRAGVSGGVDRDPYDPRPDRAQLGGAVRLWAGREWGGVWAGVGATRPWERDVGPGGGEAVAGAWADAGRITLAGSLRRRQTRALAEVGRDSTGVDPTTCRAAPAGGKRSVTECQRRFSSTDLEASAGWQRWGVEAAVGGGARLASRYPSVGDPTWAFASAAVPVARGVAITAAVTRLPVDVVRQFPSRTAFALGMRLRRERPEIGSRRPREPADDHGGAAAPRVERVDVGAADADGARTLRVVIRTARRVEVRGDMTGWAAVTMVARAPDTWEARVQLRPGVHHVVIRVDGGAWRPPRGMPVADDGFGGEVGVIVVGEASRP